MTVSSTTSRKAYTGDGLTTSFATSPVVFFDTSDLVVYVVTTATGASTTLTENTHYTVSGGSGSTGTVSLAGGSSPYGAPSASQTLVISRSVPLTQAADFINGDPNDATVMETALDKLTMLAQQNATAIARSVRQSDSSPSSITLSLPEPEAGKALGWNASATALSNLDLGVSVTTVSMTAFGTSLVGAANAAAGRTVLGSSATGDSLFTAASAAAARSAISAATSGAATGSGLTMATAKLLGRTTAGSGALEEIGVSGLTLSGGTLSVTSGLPRSYLAGCGMANGTDTINDIDIAAGKCRDSTDAFDITVAAKTKQLDAGWAAGTAAGMRYSGAAIANTTYHIWAVAKADGTQDIYATPNASASTASAALTLLQAESGGANYIYARRIGSILREGGSIVAFVQDGDVFMRSTPVLDINVTAPGTAAVTRTLSVPVGVRVLAQVQAGLTIGLAGTTRWYLSDLSQTDNAASTTFSTVAGTLDAASTDPEVVVAPAEVRTNTSAQIRSRSDVSSASVTHRITTTGWIDRRGRDD